MDDDLWTGTGFNMRVLPGEGGGERAETGLTVPTDDSWTDPIGGGQVDTKPGTPGIGWGGWGADTANWLKTVKDIFGGTSAGGQLGQLAAFGGLAALLNKFAGQQSQQPVGYQGGIPQYTATREQMPYQTGQQNELLRLKQAAQDAMGTGATQDQVREAALRSYGISPSQFDQAMKTEGTYRRPGLGGITYFSPIQYTASGKNLGGSEAAQLSGGIADIATNVGIPTAPGRVTSLASAQKSLADQTEDATKKITADTAGYVPRNYESIGTIGGASLLKGVGPAASAYVIVDGVPIYGAKQLDEVADRLGWTQQQKTEAIRTISKESGYPSIGADLYGDIFRAIRESLGQGYTMDQVYEGAMKNFGVSKEDVDAALLYNNATGADISSEDAFKLLRSGLPTRAASGGYMPGGIAMLAGGRYLRGPGDGVSDSIPAKFERSGQPARLADGEFVIDARTVSEIGNGSSEAGARKLYAMMDRVQKARKTAKRGKPSGADRELNKLA